MRLLHAFAILLLLLTGGSLVWPPAMALLQLQRAPGRILEVLPEPLPDGRTRLRIAFEFPLPPANGVRPVQLGWGVADSYFRPIGDPVVQSARAEGVMRDLMDTDEAQVRTRMVFYRAEDPAGTAVILDETAERPSRRIPVGLVLLAVAAVWSLSLWRRRV